MDSFTFVLTGILPGGKNAVKTTRTGHRYPDQRFVLWRANALSQLPAKVPHFPGPVQLLVDYVPGDLRKRDMPGMMDALLHLLEKAKLVKDDAQVVALTWTPFPLDREHPRCTVTIRTWEGV